MPRKPPKRPDWVAALLATAGALAVGRGLWIWWNGRLPVLAVRPGRVAVVTGDGRLHMFAVAVRGPVARRLTLLKSISVAWDSDPDALEIFADEAFKALIMRGDQGAIAICDQEIGTDFIDTRISVWDAGLNTNLFFTTDNSTPVGTGPNGDWLGRDTAAPAAMRAAQIQADANFAADPENHSGLEFVARYNDDQDGTLELLGWTGAGHLAFAGTALFEQVVEGWFDADDQQEWWRVVGPQQAGSWGKIAEGNDALPANFAVLGTPALTLNISLRRRALFVDGIRQTNPELTSGVLAFVGPYL